ncbi:MAG: M56 family metallopeptidase, partial [Planctomycetota bacterium]
MNATIEQINRTGQAFVEFALPMLIQSGVLILILLLVDLVLRKKVRAVFRYWIWMLVLVKLVLPTSLSSPVSVGRWLGDELAYVDAIPAPAAEPQVDIAPMPAAEAAPAMDPLPVETITRAPAVVPVEPTARNIEPTPPHIEPASAVPQPESVGLSAPHVTPLSWQGGALLSWLAALVVMLLLLLQRALFVRRLVAQASDADRPMTDALEHCRQSMKMNKKVGLKVSSGATSPAVCGLFKPAILVPGNLTPSLSSDELRVVLLHELAHIKRYDLWVNLAQTILQIFYFYNPLLWLANAMIRRSREQAVDEMVLVAMGEKARQYPETLVNVAKLAFKRPVLSLRLIGVVESKSALTGRIKHILNRPIPKTAKLGIFGLVAVIAAAAILLPMAKSIRGDRDLLIKLGESRPARMKSIVSVDKAVWSMNYQVEFTQGEKLLVVAELYQAGKPMRVLGRKIFEGSTDPNTLSVYFTRAYKNEAKTILSHSARVQLGDESLEIPEFTVEADRFHYGEGWGRYGGGDMRKKRHQRTGQEYARLEPLFYWFRGAGNLEEGQVHFWIPGCRTTQVRTHHYVQFSMTPLSRLKYLTGYAAAGWQGMDGKTIPEDLSAERAEAMAEQYFMKLTMPLPKLTAHKYYKVGDPIHFYMNGMRSEGWKPRFDEIDYDGDVSPICVLIDGEEYEYRRGFAPFSGGGGTLGIPDSLYVDEDDFHLPPGKHTFAYGWKDLDVVNLDDPDRVVHYERLTTDVAEFEVVEQIPADYYAEVYQEGWEEILRRSIETPFTDDMRKYHTWGTLFALQIGSLPFDIAFEIYAQAEGSAERVYAGSVAWQARLAGSYLMGCDHNVDEINWDTVGQKRWRLILVPSRKVAMRRPPIRHYYGREFVTEWATFEKSDRFEENRRRAYVRDILDRNVPRGAGSIRADKPVDLDGLTRRRRGDTDEAWPLPEGFDLGWSPDKGGTLRIDPKSNVRMLWFPEADASLSKVRDETRQRLVELPDSTTSEINPPMGERTLLAVRSSEGRDYFVRLKKIKETWADLSWWPARGVDDGPFGRIVDTSERPVRGATLVFSREDTTDRDPQKITVTAETLGGFILPAMKPGESLAASISAPGFESLKSVHIERLSDGTYLPKDLTFKVRRFGAVSGSVTGPDGKPLAGAPLSVTTVVAGPDLSDAKVTVNHLRAISRGGGRFGIMGVPPGTHLLYYPWGGPSTKEIEDGEWLPPHGPGDRRPSAPVDGVLGAKVVKVAYDQKVKNTVIDLSKSTCSAEGRVRDSAGRPIGGAKVYLCWKVP